MTKEKGKIKKMKKMIKSKSKNKKIKKEIQI